jgi:hypothetical protein
VDDKEFRLPGKKQQRKKEKKQAHGQLLLGIQIDIERFDFLISQAVDRHDGTASGKRVAEAFARDIFYIGHGDAAYCFPAAVLPVAPGAADTPRILIKLFPVFIRGDKIGPEKPCRKKQKHQAPHPSPPLEMYPLKGY